jgi:hypothetical protein
VEQIQKIGVGKVMTLPHKVLIGVIAQVRKRYKQLKSRYGPRYTKALVGAAFVAVFLPIPGSVLIAVALIVVCAEVHRAIFKRDGLSKASAKELVMSINCEVILQWSATPGELTKLGAALWRWGNRAAGDTGIYQFLDNQPLADLIAGKLPVSSQREGGGIHVKFRDEASHDRQATVDGLRLQIPAQGVEDILVGGKSGTLIDPMPGLHFCSGPRAGAVASAL